MNKSELIEVRKYTLDDKNFIMATWLRGLYYSNEFFNNVPKNLFMQIYAAALENLLNNPNTLINVSCLKEDPTVILGYAVMTGDSVLHWVFVKKEWRKIGIARDLVPNTVRVSTHYTDTGLSIIKRKGLIFNPFYQ